MTDFLGTRMVPDPEASASELFNAAEIHTDSLKALLMAASMVTDCDQPATEISMAAFNGLALMLDHAERLHEAAFDRAVARDGDHKAQGGGE